LSTRTKRIIHHCYVDPLGWNYVQPCMETNLSRDLPVHGKIPGPAHSSKAFSFLHPKDLPSVSDYQGHLVYYLFDNRERKLGKVPNYGGSGKQFDWNILYRYNGNTPFLLSGGINSYSARALHDYHHSRMIGTDINSRFESSPGIKDVERIERFIKDLKG